MARYTGSVCRLCRRENQKLFLKGTRCYTERCSLNKRAYAPGQHGQARKKVSEYGLQLREKQKAKRYYGILEKQFYGYYEMAVKKAGITCENLLIILESRLDNIVYRMGLASTRSGARQFVNHGHVSVNGRKVDIPSYQVKPGDVVAVRENSKDHKAMKESLEKVTKTVDYVSFDKNKLEGTYIRLPERSELSSDVNESLVVEFYNE